MADRHRSHHHASRPASANPSRSSLPAGMVYQPSYADESYSIPSGSRYPVTTPRGYSSSTATSGQPTTTRTYAVTQDGRFHPRTRDHSHTRRSTMDSTVRPPVIITTTQKDRSQNNLALGTGTRNGSPIRDDHRHGDSQHYAVPASTRRSRSSARPYHGDDYPRRRDRGDSLLTPHDAESYRQARPSATRSSNPRPSAALIDYGDDGYKYTNAGELVRYDLDNSKPSRSQRHDGLNQDYYRPKPVYANSHRRTDGRRYETDRAYVVPHGGPPPSTRGFDKISRDGAIDRDRQAPPAAPKPPKPLPHSEATSSLRDAKDVRHSRPVSVSQEPPYRDNSYYLRDDFRDRRGHVRGRSDDRGAENKRPHSTQFYDDSVPNRGFGVRASPDAALDGRRDDRRSREEPRRNDYLHSGEKPLSEPRKATQDRPLSFSGTSKHPESDRKDNGRDTSYSILETAGTGLGITAAAAGFAASRRDTEPARGPEEQTETTYGAHAGNLTRHETEAASARVLGEASNDRYSPRPEASRAGAEKSAGLSDHGGASLIQHNAPSASDSDDAGKGRVRSKQRPSNSFNPNDTGDLRQIKEQLAALRVQDNQKQTSDSLSGEIERRPRSASPRNEAPGISEPGREDENYAVGFPIEKKHARVVSPPRDKRDEKPLRGILKQPSARFPEDSNPIREGVAPHKEDKKLKEVPPGARWTSISRKIVNPEALTIGKERFEERADVVIVLRVLSKEEIQAYAAATQVLRERRREREDPDREQERRRHHDDDSSQPHRRHRHHGDDGEYDNDVDGEAQGRGMDLSDDEKQRGARDDGSDSSGQRDEVGKDNEGVRRPKRGAQDGETGERRRGRTHSDDRDGDIERRGNIRRDGGEEREQHRSDGDKYPR